jgi:hypothetical protein
VVVVDEAHAQLQRPPADLAEQSPEALELLLRRRASRGAPREQLQRVAPERLDEARVLQVRLDVLASLGRVRVDAAAREAEQRQSAFVEQRAELGGALSPRLDRVRAELDAAEAQRGDVFDRLAEAQR